MSTNLIQFPTQLPTPAPVVDLTRVPLPLPADPREWTTTDVALALMQLGAEHRHSNPLSS